MRLPEKAQAAARLATVNSKCQSALESQLDKWFAAQFIKGMKLPLLRALHQAGAYSVFAELLSDATDTDRSTVLGKLDKYRPELQMRPRAEIMAHIEDLASGRVQPAAKPKPASKPKATKAKPPKKKVGIISGSKY